MEKSERYGLCIQHRTCPPQHPNLSNVENDLLGMIKHIKFKQMRSVKSSSKAFIPADKTRNFYEMDKTLHDKVPTQNVTKTYRQSDHSAYKNSNNEAKSIAESLNVVDKVECLAKTDAFITLKDHKEGFSNDPKCRLINPAKSQLGKVSKSLLEDINKTVRESTKVNQWHNTNEVIQWFKKVKDKKKCTFVQFDIEEFFIHQFPNAL